MGSSSTRYFLWVVAVYFMAMMLLHVGNAVSGVYLYEITRVSDGRKYILINNGVDYLWSLISLDGGWDTADRIILYPANDDPNFVPNHESSAFNIQQGDETVHYRITGVHIGADDLNESMRCEYPDYFKQTPAAH